MKTNEVAIGSMYGIASRVVVLLSGFAIHIVLARRLGPELFGLYTLILSILVWFESSISQGIASVFRKIISENQKKLLPVIAATKTLATPYSLAVMLLLVVLSPLVAVSMNDNRLILLLVIASLDIPFFGMYSTYMGILNGHGAFLTHSVLMSLYAISRTIFIVGAVLVGLGVTGALFGNAAGSFLGLLLALYYVKRSVRNESEKIDEKRRANIEIWSRLRSFGLPYLSLSLLTSVLIHMDLWFVKALSENMSGSDEVVGYYAAAYNVARIPFFLITGITFTVFPAISRAVFENRLTDAKTIIKQLLRLVLIILMPLIAMVYVTADRIVELLFSSAFLPAGDSLKILFAGVSAFSIFLFFINVSAADNKPQFGFLLSLFLVPLAMAFNYFLISSHGIEGAAAATTAVSLIGLVVSGTFVWRRFGRIVGAGTLARLVIASGCVFLVSRYDALYQVHLILGYAVLALIYGVALLVLGEIDLRTLRLLFQSLLKPRRSSS